MAHVTSLTYHCGMNQLTDLSKRLAKIENLSLFCRVHKLNYRTVQRMRANERTPTLDTFNAVNKALDKEDKTK